MEIQKAIQENYNQLQQTLKLLQKLFSLEKRNYIVSMLRIDKAFYYKYSDKYGHHWTYQIKKAYRFKSIEEINNHPWLSLRTNWRSHNLSWYPKDLANASQQIKQEYQNQE